MKEEFDALFAEHQKLLGELQAMRAVAKPEQEPVACDCTNPWAHDQCTEEKGCKIKKKLLRTPPQRTWVGLTDEEILAVVHYSQLDNAKAIEAKLKEKNT